MKRARSRAGFTLMELMVVITIIGILAGFAIPQYLKTIENSRADDAAALMNMVATTNRMYALDHPTAALGGGNGYVRGQLTTACGAGACLGDASSPCELVRCKYLTAQDFDSKCWGVYADNPTAGMVACSGIGGAVLGTAACTSRKTAAFSGNSTCISSAGGYSAWQYSVTTNGVIASVGGAPSAISP